MLALCPGALHQQGEQPPEQVASVEEPRCEICSDLLGCEDGSAHCEDRECAVCHAVVCHRSRCWHPRGEGGLCVPCVQDEAMARHEAAQAASSSLDEE